MRTEVKIGMVICVLVAGLVIAFSMFRAPDEPAGKDNAPASASKPAGSKAVAAKPAEKPKLTVKPAPQPVRPSRTVARPTRPSTVAKPAIPTVPAKDASTAAAKPKVDYSAIAPRKPAASAANNPVSVKPAAPKSYNGPIGSSPSVVAPRTNAPTKVANSPASKPRMYVVQAGDSGFYYIAQKLYGSQRYAYLIRNANPNAESTRLRVGQKLIIPPLKKNTDINRPTVTATPSGAKIHVVAEGDVAWNLAKKYYGSGKYTYLLQKANKSVNLDRLIIGQKLVIPPMPNVAASQQGSVKTASGSGRVHIVADGDSAWKISERYYGSGKYVNLIASANGGVDIENLKVGQKLVIPANTAMETVKSTAGTPSSSSAASNSSSSDRGSYSDPRPMFD